jgi:hypothetical protein
MSRHAVIYPKSRTIRPLYRDGGISDGNEEIYYETSIDLAELAVMARDAARNKSGMSNDGPLRVRIIERRRTA